MAVQGVLWLAKRLSLNLNSSFLNRISLLLIQIATQLSSRGWVDPVPDPILPEKFLGYSRESNPEPLGWQSDVPTTIPNTLLFKKIGLSTEISSKVMHTIFFLLSSDIRSEGSIEIVEEFEFDFLMIFYSTSLPQSKNVF